VKEDEEVRPINVRLDPELYKLIQDRAKRNCRKMSQEVHFVLKEAIVAEVRPGAN